MPTNAELSGRLDAVEARLDAFEGGGDLAARVEHLENMTGNRAPTQQDRVAADMAIVSRFASSREEAIAQQAARERLADLGLIDERGALRAARSDDEVNEDAPVGTEAPEGVGTPVGTATGGGE